jgi:hypothetical protein
MRLLLATALLALSACNIYDDRSDCPQGIHARFYSRTTCSTDTLYPEAISNLHLYVFDADGRLVSDATERGVSLTPHYERTVEAADGVYTVVAWSGVDVEGLEVATPLSQGTTRKEDLLFRLKQNGTRAASLAGKQLYYGESKPVYLPDPADYGSVFRTVHINMLEQTNRINVSVEGLPHAASYEIAVETRLNGISFDGKPASGVSMEYPSGEVTTTDGVLRSSFTTLTMATGMQTQLVVRDKNTTQELYRGDLLGTLLLKNPAVNLECDHDFDIRFTTADKCGCGEYMITEIWVNNWLVHSYDTDFK